MNIDRFITNLNTLYPEVPVFGQTLSKNDILNNKNLFLYRDSNEYYRGQSERGLHCRFYLTFMTRDGKQLNMPELIEQCTEKTGLHFISSAEEVGKMIDTDEEALAVVLTFSYPVKVCFS